MKVKLILLMFFAFSLMQCKNKENTKDKILSDKKENQTLQKFEPKEGVLVFVGQELEAGWIRRLSRWVFRSF